MNRVTEELLPVIPVEKRKTFTRDDGKELSGYRKSSRKIEVDVYFTHPYHS